MKLLQDHARTVFLMVFYIIGFEGVAYAQVPSQPNSTTQKSLKDASLRITIKAYDFELDDRTRRDLELGLANVFTFFHYRFRIGYHLPFHMKVNMFKDGAQFDAFFNEPGIHRRVAGRYTFRTKEVSVHWTGSRDKVISTAIHETSHRVLGAAIRSTTCPMWLNEGLAEYFGQGRASGNNVVIKPNTYQERLLRDALRNGSLPALKEHVNLHIIAWQGGNTQLNYAIAWSMVSLLMSSNQGKALIQKILHELAYDRPSTFDSVLAFDKHYKGGLTYFEKEWHKYIEGRKKSISYPSDVRRRAFFEVIPSTLRVNR
ncbi:MAG: DUF1570 domain-containing protein [Verrucomicrobiota bacterium]